MNRYSELKRRLYLSLPPSKAERLRQAKRHLRGFLDVLFRGLALIGDTALHSVAGRDFLLTVKSFTKSRLTEKEREKLKRSLMEKVIVDPRYGTLLETKYLENVIGDRGIHNCLLGAAYFGRGEVDKAIGAFKAAVESEPTSLNYLLLARSLSCGLQDERQATEILELALQRCPGDFALTLSLAAGYFHLGDTDRANRCLDTMAEEMKAILRDSDTNIIGLEAEVATAIREKLAVRPKGAKRDSYSETSVDSYWEALFFHMNSLNRFQSRWAWLNHLYQEQIGRVLTKIDPAIRQVVNFGVFCGNPDYGLALRFPDVTFVGVDREIRTKKLNDLAYRAPNLHFIAADILEVVADLANKSRPSLLYHARTATMCYPEYLRTLYRTCAAASVDYIALWESQAISRSTLRFQDFDAMSEDAIPFGGQTLIHNYKKLLEEAGYEIVVLENWPLSCDLLVDQDILGDGYVFMVARRAAA